MAQGCIGKRGQRPSKKKKPPERTAKDALPPPLTYATAGVAGGSDVVGGGVVGFFRRAFVFGLVFPFALVFPLIFDLVFMVFPFSVASADHGTGAHGNKVCGGRQRKSPRTYATTGGSQVTFANRTGGTGGKGVRLAWRGMWGLAEELPRDTSPQARQYARGGNRSNLPWDRQISRLGWKSGDGCKPRRIDSWGKLASRLDATP